MSFPHLGNFQALLLQVLFNHTQFVLSFPDSDDMSVRSLVIVPLVPGALVQSIFFSVVKIV